MATMTQSRTSAPYDRLSHLTQLLREANNDCLDWLTLRAAIEGGRLCPLLQSIGDRLRALTAVQRERAAMQPFLLAGLRFDDVDWWAQIARQPSMRSSAGDAHRAVRRASIHLTRTVLTLCWHTLQVRADTASVLLGMPAQVNAIVRELKLASLDGIATAHFSQLRPRWSDRPWLWRDLIASAQSNDPQALRSFSIHALQHLAEGGPCERSV